MIALFQRLIPLALAAYWLLIFTGTHLPLPEAADLSRGRDKIMHLVAYAGLAWLLGMWFWSRGRSDVRAWLTVFVLAAGYGAVDELLQPPFGRTADFYDWLADCAGATIGLASLAVTQFAYRWIRDGLRPETPAPSTSA